MRQYLAFVKVSKATGQPKFSEGLTPQLVDDTLSIAQCEQMATYIRMDMVSCRRKSLLSRSVGHGPLGPTCKGQGYPQSRKLGLMVGLLFLHQ